MLYLARPFAPTTICLIQKYNIMRKHSSKLLAFMLMLAFTLPGMANDICTDAIPITCGESIDGTTAGSTFDNIGTCGTSNTASGVWYSFTGNGGTATLSTCNTAAYDTKISVFTGSCAALTCIGGQDDAAGCAGFTTELSVLTTLGNTYFVLVHGFGSATGTFTLSLDCGSPAEGNDPCDGAIAVDCGDVVSGSTASAAFDGTAFCGTSNTAPGVWYSFTAASDASVTATTCSDNTDYDTKLTIFTGSCTSLVCVDGDDDDITCTSNFLHSIVTWCVAAGETYLILVHGFGTATGNFDLSINCGPLPANDAPCAAEALSLGVSSAFDNNCSTADADEVSPGAGTGTSSCDSQDGWCSFETEVQNSIWFTFEVPASGAVSIETAGFDDQLAVWSASDCSDFSTFSEIAANDDGGAGLSAALTLHCLDPGEILYIQVDGFAGASGEGTIIVEDLGGTPISCDAGGCQTKFVGYEPSEGLNHLAVEASGGTPPYSYEWSGDGIVTNPNIFSVSVDPEETTTYTVVVTDSNGCTTECSVEVNVVDVTCGNNGNKISVCHMPPDNPQNTQQICIGYNAVESHLSEDEDLLGPCGNTCLATNPPPPEDTRVFILEDVSFEFQNEAKTVVLNDVSILPNPFNSSAAIKYTPSIDGNATIDIYDISGSHVTRLLEADVVKGDVLEVEISGEQLTSYGIYVYQIRVANQLLSGKLIYAQ